MIAGCPDASPKVSAAPAKNASGAAKAAATHDPDTRRAPATTARATIKGMTAGCSRMSTTAASMPPVVLTHAIQPCWNQ